MAINLKDLSPSKMVRRKSKTTRIIDDRRVVNNTRVIKNVKAMSILTANKTVPHTEDYDTKSIALDVLNGISITIVQDSIMDKDFSLSKLTKKSRLLKNDNIVDPDFRTKQNEKADPLSQFPNRTSPFYELDEDMADYQKNDQKFLKQIEQADLSSTVADLYDMNTAKNSTLKLKQFSRRK